MILAVMDLDDPDSDKPAKGKPARKPLDLDAPVEDNPARAGKGDGKLEIVRDEDSTYRNRKRPQKVDRVKERKRRRILTSLLVTVTVAAIAVIAVFLLKRPPTFGEARNAPLPITSTPTAINAPIAGRNRGPAPVVPNAPQNPLNNLNQDTDRGRDSTSGGIN